MGRQSSNLGWPPASGGGGGSDYPFALAYAKTRQWRIAALTTIPQGAMVVTAINRGMADATIKIGTGADSPIGPGKSFQFIAQQNTVDKKWEVSKEITLTPAPGSDMEVYVSYPASSATDPNSL
jgi:hypothetical protein